MCRSVTLLRYIRGDSFAIFGASRRSSSLMCSVYTHTLNRKKNCAQSDGIYKWVIFGGVLFLFILLANTKLIIYTRRYIYNSTVSVRLCTVFRRVPLVRRKRAKSLPLLMLILFTLFTLLCGCRCKERRAIDLCGIGCVNIKRADTPLYYFFRCVCVAHQVWYSVYNQYGWIHLFTQF